ncbi:MAG TPA: fluoride efflux transporter CrcB [Holophagaceae bacterium]|jgi:CrcB protein|nr:fluoride efflux transporter CrcB [Holophagaceae bacterium]
MTWISFFAVGFGAFGGAVLRWGLGLAFNAAFPTIPIGTLAANLVGGLLMGLAIGGLPAFQALPPAGRLALTTGFLGGLTTFSTFSAESITLFLNREIGWAFVHTVLHLLGSLLMTLAGMGIVRMLWK